MIAKLSALLFFALLIAIAVVVFGRLSKRLVFDFRATRSFRDPCDPGVNLSVLEITACVSQTNICDGHLGLIRIVLCCLDTSDSS